MSGAFGSYLAVTAVVGKQTHFGPPAVVGILLLGLASGAATGAIIAYFLERVAYRPLRRRGAPKLAFLISAIGASFFLAQLFGKLFNRLTNNIYPVFFNKDAQIWHWERAQFTVLQAIIIGAAVVLMFFLDRLVRRTKLGRSIRATAEDAPTAALMGVDIDRTISRTFIIGGALAGAAGFLFGLAFVFSNTMGFIPGIKAFAAAVLGGIGNVRGAMLGGLLLGMAESVIPSAPWGATSGWIGLPWTDVVAFVILILVLVFRPTGLLGERLGRAA
jgi:branched-chain amino acid transport system permease protein